MTSKMKKFGEKVGIAFQIKDDLFDYTSDKVGKPTGNDIKEKKLTLPLIYTLSNVDNATKRKIIYIVKNESKDKKKLDFVLKNVSESGGIDYTLNIMDQYKNEALSILQTFPEGEIKNGFAELVNFVTDRKY
jgi:octaprenyl-diphosphate synthase